MCAIKKDRNALCAPVKVQRFSVPLLQLFCTLYATAVSLGSNAVKLQRAYRGLKLTTAAVRDTISDGQALSIHDKLVSQNGRYALGFFETGNQIVLASLKSSKPYCPVVCGMEKDLTRRRKCQGTLVTCHL